MIGLLNYGELEIQRSDFERAATYLEEGTELANQNVVNTELSNTLDMLNQVYKELLLQGKAIDQEKHIDQKDMWAKQHKMLATLKNRLQSTEIQNLLYYNIQLNQASNDLESVNKRNRISIGLLIGSVLLCCLLFYIFYPAYSKVQKARKVLFKQSISRR